MANYDAGLLERARSGDTTALAALTQQCTPDIYRLARSMLASTEDAEDATAEIISRLFMIWNRIPETGFKPWLLRVSRNHCCDVLRRRSLLHRLMPKLYYSTDARYDPSPEDAAIEEDQKAMVQRALRNLPEQERTAVVLRYYHQLTYEEIAQAMEASPSTVGSWLSRARARLKKIIKWEE